MQGKLEAALVAYRRRSTGRDPQANQNYSIVDADALARAAEHYRRHTQANPTDAHAFNDLGNTLRELGRHDEALAAYGRALALNPDLAEAHFSRAFVLLLLGDYAQGWKEYEWRWRIPAFNAPARRFQPIRAGGALGWHDTLRGEGLATRCTVRAAPLAARVRK
jgi:tetratricopeptide (TPR) repeat protein